MLYERNVLCTAQQMSQQQIVFVDHDDKVTFVFILVQVSKRASNYFSDGASIGLVSNQNFSKRDIFRRVPPIFQRKK